MFALYQETQKGTMDFMHFIFPLFVEIGSHRESNTYVRRRNLEVAKTSFSSIISPVNGIESSGMSQTSQSGNQKNNTIYKAKSF